MVFRAFLFIFLFLARRDLRMPWLPILALQESLLLATVLQQVWDLGCPATGYSPVFGSGNVWAITGSRQTIANHRASRVLWLCDYRQSKLSLPLFFACSEIISRWQFFLIVLRILWGIRINYSRHSKCSQKETFLTGALGAVSFCVRVQNETLITNKFFMLG